MTEIKKKIRVLVTDDHKMFRQGIISLLEGHPQIDVLGAAGNGSEALRLLGEKQVDILITDLTMTGMGGKELTRMVSKKYPMVKILVLTMHRDSTMIKEMLKEGISGYILKNTGKKELIAAIEAVNREGVFFSEDVKSTFMESMVTKKATGNVPIRLTKRETEVLKLIAQEFTNPEISEKLFISLHTVETHRRNIMKKLSAKNSVGLLRYAIQSGLVE